MTTVSAEERDAALLQLQEQKELSRRLAKQGLDGEYPGEWDADDEQAFQQVQKELSNGTD